MKFLSALFLMLSLALYPLPVCSASINGQNYVSLAEWVGANGLKTSLLRRGEEIVATNPTTHLVFDRDSNTAEINGVHVALSFPVASDHGNILIAQFDLDNTVRPLLFPSRYLEPKHIATICLDPGHGGKDTGNRVGGFFSHNEKAYTLLLAQELHDQLRRAGFNVILTKVTGRKTARSATGRLPASPDSPRNVPKNMKSVKNPHRTSTSP